MAICRVDVAHCLPFPRATTGAESLKTLIEPNFGKEIGLEVYLGNKFVEKKIDGLRKVRKIVIHFFQLGSGTLRE